MKYQEMCKERTHLRLNVILVLILSLSLLMTACYKDMEIFEPREEIPEVIESGNIDEFFENVPTYKYISTFLGNERKLIVTENNTIIEIAADIFEFSDGSSADSLIEFKYYEMLDPALYAFKDFPSISQKRILDSEGVFRFEAYSEGKEVFLKSEKGIRVRLENENPSQEAQLFTAEGGGADFTWIPLTNDGTSPANTWIEIAEWELDIATGGQDFIFGYGYEFNSPMWEWINVDIFVDVPEDEKTSVCVELPEKYTSENTLAFMLFKDYNSILGLYPNAEKMQFCEPYEATPIGSKVSFIVIANLEENVFNFALVDAEIKENHVEYIEPEWKSLEDIIAIIEGL